MRTEEYAFEDDGDRTKRQRVSHDNHYNSPAPAAAAAAHEERSFYNEILQGHVNGTVRNSWLRYMRKIGPSHQPLAVPKQGISPIQSLTRQLLQVKRRLWPAAEQCAHALGTMPHREFAEARRMCNPMEPLGEGRDGGMNDMFMNRSAIKLANIDAILNFALTQVPGNDFLFVDLCGAPGGFSEYLMNRFQATRQSGSCRGYGMSLFGTNEHGVGTTWKLDDTTEQEWPVKLNYRISGGSDGTGDIYKWENVIALSDGIQYDVQSAGLPQQKVHLVVADGGFDAQRDSECQEELAQKMVLCEIAAGLHLLQHGGRLIVKMFGFQTSSMRTAMKSLYYCFNDIVVLKPISSRPASSERYLVCTGFRGTPLDWNGPRWINSVLLGRVQMTDSAQRLDLDTCLDEVDGDILDLNLKSCFAILSYLERKLTQDYGGGSDPWYSHRPRVNVELYKHAWGLI
jgi:cap1 methyltransferase